MPAPAFNLVVSFCYCYSYCYYGCVSICRKACIFLARLYCWQGIDNACVDFPVIVHAAYF